MNVLAIDTASPRPAVALLAAGHLFEEPLPGDRRASEELLPAARRVLAAGGRRLEECERFAVCAGPGSFTGLRVGLATAWGFGRGLGIAVEAVSTLEALAEASRPHGATRLVAALEAGRGELVCERFVLEFPRARSLAPPERVAHGEVTRFAAGDRIIALPPALGGADGLSLPMSVAAGLALAVARAPRPSAPGGSRAIYSRPSAAEEKRGAP